MEKPISRKQHGFTDYSYIPTVAAAPYLFDFEDEEIAKLLTRVQSGGILLSSLLTRAEWGLFKLMPYQAHLILDASVGVFSLAAPWLFGFSKNKKARNTFLVMGLVGISAGLFSQREEMPAFKL